MSYDFKQLSSYDFELLVRDLLQKHLGYFFESFKSGRDSGIDLRYSKNKENDILVQCKHYAGSTYSNLLSNLKHEVPKVEKLKPKRYIIVTSLGLTPSNKEEIKLLFEPYCNNSEDILGLEDLNNLLTIFPEVERNHFKLWLTSTTVLDRIVHSSIYTSSNILHENIINKLKLYVQTNALIRANRIIRENGYCIISGMPGIGKTTIAEILIVDYLSKGYEVYKISESIREAFDVYSPAKKQVFYYDDFLGQTTLVQKLGKNEDDDLIKFIELSKKSVNTKVILTTREYILNQAKMNYEKLRNTNFDLKCIISLQDFSSFQKAKILYNHLYFSEIPEDYKAVIVKDKNYLKIINHPNYNPRIIDWMTNWSLLKTVKTDYFNQFMQILNNPMLLWEHIYSNQLSIHAKHLLLVLSTFKYLSHIDLLKIAFDALHLTRAKQYNISIDPYDFRNALKELDSTFIRIDNGKIVYFSNPSIKDFLENHIKACDQDFVDLCNNVKFFFQCLNIWNAFGNDEVLRKNIGAFLLCIKKGYDTPICDNKLHYSILRNNKDTLERRLIIIIDILSQLKPDNYLEIIKEYLNSYMQTEGSAYKNDLLELVKLLKEIENLDEDAFVQFTKNEFFSDLEELHDFMLFVQFAELFPNKVTEAQIKEIQNSFEEVYDDILYYAIDSDDINYLEQCLSEIEEVGLYFSLNVANHMEEIEKRIAEIESQTPEDDYDDDRYSSNSSDYFDSSQIDALFDTLI